MENEVNCSNCREEYTHNNPPRLLTHCGHTFCQRCLVKLAHSHDGKSSLTCPDDQMVLELNAGVLTLPKNIALLRYIEARQKNLNPILKEDSSLEISKVTRNEDLQQDEEGNQLLTAITPTSPKETPPSPSESRSEGTGCLPEGQATIQDLKQQVKIQQKTVQPQVPEVQMCLLHQKPIEVVCMFDLQRLCSKCAIFGQHRGHDFRSLEEIDSGNKRHYQQIINIFDEKSTLHERMLNKTTEKELITILNNKSTKLKTEIRHKFKKLAEELAKAEKAALKKLEETACSVERKLKKLLVPDNNLRSEFDQWESTSFKRITMSQSHSNEETLKFYLQGSDIISEGKQILAQLQSHESKAILQVDKIIEDIEINYHQSHCLTAINMMVEVIQGARQNERKPLQPLPAHNNTNGASLMRAKEPDIKLVARQPFEDYNMFMKTQANHESDESLLQFNDQTDNSYASKSNSIAASRLIDHNSPTTKSFKEEIIFINTPSLTNDLIARPSLIKQKATALNFNSGKENKENKENKEIQPALNREAVKKKMRTLKVPDKYEKVVEGMMIDSLETVDLTGAELGDPIVTQLCDLIKNSKKCRTLKLIRNKLTDDGVAKILPLLTAVWTLNLSQNQLTEQALASIADYRHSLPQLKAVILSQNKIVERKSKPTIERLRSMGLTVSI